MTEAQVDFPKPGGPTKAGYRENEPGPQNSIECNLNLLPHMAVADQMRLKLEGFTS